MMRHRKLSAPGDLQRERGPLLVGKAGRSEMIVAVGGWVSTINLSWAGVGSTSPIQAPHNWNVWVPWRA